MESEIEALDSRTEEVDAQTEAEVRLLPGARAEVEEARQMLYKTEFEHRDGIDRKLKRLQTDEKVEQRKVEYLREHVDQLKRAIADARTATVGTLLAASHIQQETEEMQEEMKEIVEAMKSNHPVLGMAFEQLVEEFINEHTEAHVSVHEQLTKKDLAA